MVTITQPAGPRPHRSVFHGRVSKRHRPVQVLVLAHDGRRYLQADAVVHGHHWRAEVCLGFPQSLGDYTVTAVTGARITVPVLSADASLPPGAVASAPIVISRADD